jgi:hypothetical protein
VEDRVEESFFPAVIDLREGIAEVLVRHDIENEEEDSHHFDAAQTSLLHMFVLGRNLFGCNIKAVNVVTVLKVVDEVPLDRMIAIPGTTHKSTLTCSSEVSLQGRSSSVADAKPVSVVSPDVAESYFQIFTRKLFKSFSSRR